MSKSKYDNKGFPWLRLKNWKKYQPDDRLRNKEAVLPWVRDYVEKLDNYEFTQLTFFQRALFEGLCLLAGKRPLRTIPNDPVWIARALHTLPEECHCVPQALLKLLAWGFVLPSLTEKFSEESGENAVREGEGDREGEGEGLQLASQLVSYEEAEASAEVEGEEGFEVVDEGTPVVELPCYALLHSEFGVANRLPEKTIRRVHSALKALGKDEVWMQGCIQFALKHAFWKKCVFSPATFASKLINGIDDPEENRLPAQYNVYVAQRRAAGAGKR